MKLTPLCFIAYSADPSKDKSIQNQAFANTSGYSSVSTRKSNRGLFSGVSILASLAVAISVSGAFDTALAAPDGPKPVIAKVSQDEPLEVPGSFKDLPVATDSVTAKRLPEHIVLPSAAATTTDKLTIDTEKGASTSAAAIVEKAAAAPVDSYAEGDMVDFHATAYCLKGRTASGMDTRPGMIAADPRVLPLGTIVHIRAGRYTGTYTVMDTGGLIKGRVVDVYVSTYREAIAFGRRQVKIKVIGRPSAKARKDGKYLMASER